MEKQPKPFEVQINQRIYRLVGGCAIALYREQPQFDHIVINEENDEVSRGFNNPELCHYMAGYVIQRDEFGQYVRPTIVSDENGLTFEQEYGWMPPVVERNQAEPEIKEAATLSLLGNPDEEWLHFFDDETLD